ncbi:MAG: hypothetical protein HXK61_04100 [Atopobiaceae bacterium]|nr:hypothetical protein [Atopobiaceae bacterium]
MAQLISVKKVEIGPKNLTATIELSEKAPRMTSDDAEGTQRILDLLPGLSKHLCLGDSDARFGLVAQDTETAHLLEHVTVELLALTNLAGDISSGKTSLIDSKRGLYEIILACPDDVLVAASLSSAIWLLNWAYGKQDDEVEPDIDAIVSGLVDLITSLNGEKNNASDTVDEVDAEATDATEVETADAVDNQSEVEDVQIDSDEDSVANATDDKDKSEEAAVEVAEDAVSPAVVDDANSDNTGKAKDDIPDDWNMINVPRSKPVR